MKTLTTDWSGKTSRVSFCSASSEVQSIEIAGRTLTPNEDLAYVEFFMSHAFPVVTKYRTGIHPAVVANSYKSLEGKVFNMAHLMRKYDPKKNPRDRILGYIAAVEFPNPPGAMVCECGCAFDYYIDEAKCPKCSKVSSAPLWKVGALSEAPGIRAVAALFKAAESVIEILTSWFAGQSPVGGEWSVSMENSFLEENGGFLVLGMKGVESFVASTPPDLIALGYTYVPCLAAPELLFACLNTEADDKREGIVSARICRDFAGQPVIFLLGGLNDKIRYRGTGLTPGDGARESEARIRTMLASEPVVDVQEALNPLTEFGEKAVSFFFKK